MHPAGGAAPADASKGQRLVEAWCKECHSIDGSKSKGPSWKGIFGKQEKLRGGASVTVDENYLRESMLQPQAKVVEGYEPIMPTFQGLLRENEIRGLVAFIKSLQ